MGWAIKEKSQEPIWISECEAAAMDALGRGDTRAFTRAWRRMSRDERATMRAALETTLPRAVVDGLLAEYVGGEAFKLIVLVAVVTAAIVVFIMW